MAELPKNLAGEANQILNDIEEWQMKYSDFFSEKSGFVANIDLNVYDFMVRIKLKLKYLKELASDIESDTYVLQAMLINRKQGKRGDI